MRLKRQIDFGKNESPSMSTRKLSLFNRWKNQNLTTEVDIEGISEEELVEYKEAFRLFDKASSHHLHCKLHAARLQAVGYGPSSDFCSLLLDKYSCYVDMLLFARLNRFHTRNKLYLTACNCYRSQADKTTVRTDTLRTH